MGPDVSPESTLSLEDLLVDFAPSSDEFIPSVVASFNNSVGVVEGVSKGEESISSASGLLVANSSHEVKSEVSVRALAHVKGSFRDHLGLGEEVEGSFERDPDPVGEWVGSERVGLGVSKRLNLSKYFWAEREDSISQLTGHL